MEVKKFQRALASYIAKGQKAGGEGKISCVAATPQSPKGNRVVDRANCSVLEFPTKL